MPASHNVPTAVMDLCTDADRVIGRIEPRLLLQRAALLPESDRQLLQLALTGTHSIRQLAALAGMHPGSLSRRIKRLRARLADPVTNAIVSSGAELSEVLRRIALEHFVRGRPVYTLARELGLARSEVASMVTFLRGWASRATPATPISGAA